MSSDISILTDEPTSKGLLDFDKYSTVLANVIQSSNPRFAIGIFGGWGTGKTTLMQMIKAHLDSKEDILTVWFNAWRYEREQYLATIPLLRTIRLRIEGRNNFASLKSALEAAMAGLVSATKVGLGPYDIDLGKLVNGAKKYGLIGANVETVYYDAVGYLNAALLNLRKKNEKLRLVIFIDDLDRCSQDRALEVMESVKAFLDVEGMIYVIGMNENTINAAIKQRYGENSYVTGSDYLKKIIQLPFYIPNWSESDLSKFLTHLVSTNVESFAGFSDYKDLIIRAVEWNPREVKRFLNHVLLAKAIFDKPVDRLIVVQALRFNIRWNWFLNHLLDETSKKGFLSECEMFLKDKTRDMATFEFKARISLLAKDEPLQEFMNAGALTRLQQIQNFEEYRRALASIGTEEHHLYISTDKEAYVASDTIHVTGMVTASLRGADVIFLTVQNPAKDHVDFGTVPVSRTTGAFSYTIICGGPSWKSGKYLVTASAPKGNEVVTATTTFFYSQAKQ